MGELIALLGIVIIVGIAVIGLIMSFINGEWRE